MGYRYLWSCIVLLLLAGGAYSLWIWRPLSLQGWEAFSDQHKEYSFSLTLEQVDIRIQGSGSSQQHDQQWQIYDKEYDLYRTGHLSFATSGYDIYTRIRARDQDAKLGGAIHKAIDTIATTHKDTLIHLLSGDFFSGYQHTTQRPRIVFLRSHKDITFETHSYCHRHFGTNNEYLCSVSGRISFPGGYWPFHGSIATYPRKEDDKQHLPDFSQAISVAELMHSVR